MKVLIESNVENGDRITIWDHMYIFWDHIDVWSSLHETLNNLKLRVTTDWYRCSFSSVAYYRKMIFGLYTKHSRYVFNIPNTDILEVLTPVVIINN